MHLPSKQSFDLETAIQDGMNLLESTWISTRIRNKLCEVFDRFANTSGIENGYKITLFCQMSMRSF